MRRGNPCPDCGKEKYASRKDARSAARTLFPGRRIRAYPCASAWHITSGSAKDAAYFREQQYLTPTIRRRRRRQRSKARARLGQEAS